MTLKDEFIRMVKENEETEQPNPNVVFFDSDLEELIMDELGARYNFKKGKFTIIREEEKAEFRCEEIENRFNIYGEPEILITLPISLKEEFINAVIESKITEQPTPNTVCADGDLEDLLDELEIDYEYQSNKFIIVRGTEQVEFKSEDIKNKYYPDVIDTIITLKE